MTKRKMLISPSILSADMTNLADAVGQAQAAGADWVHVDVMDGRFVPNISIGIPVVAALKKCTQLPLDVHLMIRRRPPTICTAPWRPSARLAPGREWRSTRPRRCRPSST